MVTAKIKLLCFAMGVAISVAVIPVYADDNPITTCSTAADLAKEGDIAGALEEARWCVTLLEQMMQDAVSSFFPEEVDGYTAGEIAKEQVMGMSMIDCDYTKDGKVISVSLTSGGSGGADNPLSAIAKMGMQMGGIGQKIRIQKRSAVIINENNSTQVIVTLKSI